MLTARCNGGTDEAHSACYSPPLNTKAKGKGRGADLGAEKQNKTRRHVQHPLAYKGTRAEPQWPLLTVDILARHITTLRGC